jgi:hypothetical protein
MFAHHCLCGNSACARLRSGSEHGTHRARTLCSQISGDLLSRAGNLMLRAGKGAYKPAWLTNLVLR